MDCGVNPPKISGEKGLRCNCGVKGFSMASTSEVHKGLKTEEKFSGKSNHTTAFKTFEKSKEELTYHLTKGNNC